MIEVEYLPEELGLSKSELGLQNFALLLTVSRVSMRRFANVTKIILKNLQP